MCHVDPHPLSLDRIESCAVAPEGEFDVGAFAVPGQRHDEGKTEVRTIFRF
jgi:hypothetical protein